MTKDKGGSFAGPLANQSIPGLGVPDDEPARSPEDPAVFGGRQSQLPAGTLIEFTGERGFKVIELPEDKNGH